MEVADPTFYLTQSQYTGTGPTSPSADPITPGAWNVTASTVGLKRNGHIRKKISHKMVNPRDLAGNAEEEDEC